MNFLGRIFCSNPFSYALGLGVGLVGFYIVHKVDEQRKLESMQKEIEAAVRAIETKKLAIVETEEETKKTKK
ncbi:MAG TPA: hypothetical protein VLB01_07055 [Thermodesulfobacteriota bacterium]|nr:hypothetical protein [Thermodesulfobacteriota bacterium]